jgi:hypothetical protein
VFAKSPATYTYTFSGSFQGLDSNGTTTASGLMRENVVFKDSAGTHTCTSNDQPWRAARKG